MEELAADAIGKVVATTLIAGLGLFARALDAADKAHIVVTGKGLLR